MYLSFDIYVEYCRWHWSWVENKRGNWQIKIICQQSATLPVLYCGALAPVSGYPLVQWCPLHRKLRMEWIKSYEPTLRTASPRRSNCFEQCLCFWAWLSRRWVCYTVCWWGRGREREYDDHTAYCMGVRTSNGKLSMTNFHTSKDKSKTQWC